MLEGEEMNIDEHLDTMLKKEREIVLHQVRILITEEINTAHTEGTPTSRLTSLYNRLDELEEK